MSGGWSKLFNSIVTSSVWCEDYPTRLVWVAMLSQADADGHVEGSIPGFANLARVTVDEMAAAVGKLSAPDPHSRTPDHEGRRIEAVAGGWRILNYAAYRHRGQSKEGSRAPYMRKYRARKEKPGPPEAEKEAPPPPPPTVTAGVTRNSHTVTRDTEAEAEAVTEQASKRAREEPPPAFDPPPGRKNPLLVDRDAVEKRCLDLVAEVAALDGKDPTNVIAAGSTWNGRTKLNPAAMSDDRLLHTVHALQKRLAELKPKAPAAPLYRIVSTEEAEAAARKRREERGGGRRSGDGPGAAPGEAGPAARDEGADRGAAGGARASPGAGAEVPPAGDVGEGVQRPDGASAEAGAGNRRRA